MPRQYIVVLSGFPDLSEIMDYATGDPNGAYILDSIEPCYDKWWCRGPTCQFSLGKVGLNQWVFRMNDGSIHETVPITGDSDCPPVGNYGSVEGKGNVSVTIPS